MKTYKINFDRCYESYPCQHPLTIIENGNSTTTLCSARHLIKLIMDENIVCTYDDFQHFEYLFNSPDHHNYLEKLNKSTIR